MIKLYKDLMISYFLVVLTGALVLALVLDSIIWLGYIFIILWIFFCAVFFNIIAIKRFNKIILTANDTCNIKDSLNRLFGIYKGRLNNKMDLIVAICIGRLLIHFGKYNMAINMLLQYDAEKLLKYKSETHYKFLYYNVLTVCYSAIDKKDDALNAHNKADEVLSSPYFNKKLKPDFETVHKINYLNITDDGTHFEETLPLLNKSLAESKCLLAEVVNRYSLVTLFAGYGRIDEAKEHIEFLKQNGGDTIYAKCALHNDFSQEFINEINLENGEFDPIKEKHYKELILSIVSAVAIVALAVVIGILTQRTTYEIVRYDGSMVISKYNFNNDGELVLFSEQFNIYPDTAQSGYNYDCYIKYLPLGDLKGCELDSAESQGITHYNFTVDFKKASEDIYGVLEVPSDENDFLEEYVDGEYSVRKYKKYLGLEVFKGYAE